MAPRAAVRQLLGNDLEMNSLGITLPRIFDSNALDTPARDGRWIITNYEDDVRAFGIIGAKLLTVRVYQAKEAGIDYGQIDAAILRVKELLTSAEQLAGEDGWVLTQATWQGGSPDVFDDTFQAIVKYCQFKIAARKEE